MRPVEVAEVLFQIRVTREGLAGRKTSRGGVKIELDTLKSLDTQLCMHLRNAELDPGSSAEDVDRLKLDLLHERVEPQQGDIVRRCLEEAAELDGCSGLMHRIVGRWAEFVNRAVFGADENGQALIADDALLPVRPWVKTRGVDTCDMSAMASAFVEWTREVNEAFRCSRGGP